MTARFVVILLSIPALVVLAGTLWASKAAQSLRQVSLPNGAWFPRIFAGSVVLSLLLLIFAGASSEHHLPPTIERALGIHGLLGSLLLLLLLLFLLPILALRIAAQKFITTKSSSPAPVPRDAPENNATLPSLPLGRRQLLKAGAWQCPALIGLGADLVAHHQLDRFNIRNIQLPSASTSLPLGLKILHISDLHVGRFTRGKVLERIVDSSSHLSPDLIAFTGDLINQQLSDLPAGIELLRALQKLAPLFVCEGNHDLFQSARTFRNTLHRAGIPLLLDQHVTHPWNSTKLRIVGATWNGLDGPAHPHRETFELHLAQNIPALLPQDASPEQPTILLAHHPHAADHAPFAHLTLSGHTHGGQLMITPQHGPGPLLYRYWSGLHTSRQLRRPIIVSNGVGNWFPIRTAAPAEIALITVT